MMKTIVAITVALTSACTYFAAGDDTQAPPDASARADAAFHPDASTQPIPDAAVQESCASDSECGANVCSALRTCLPASEVRDVSVTWTYMGYPASTYTCATVDVTQIVFSFDDSGTPAAAMVACSTGKLVIKHVPLVLQYVYTTRTGRIYGSCRYLPGAHWIDPNGKAPFDLQTIDSEDYCGI